MNRRKTRSGSCARSFGGSTHRFFRTRELYMRLVRHSISSKLRYLVVFVLIVAAMGFLFLRMPTAYLPDEDQGIMLVQAMLPANSTLEQTDEVMSRVRNYFLEHEKEAVESVFTVSGVSFSGRGQNAGLAFVKLKDWDLRNRPDLKVGAVAGRAMGEFSKIRNAMVFAFAPPAVFELGQAKGFDFQLLDRGGLGHAKLMEARNKLLGMAAGDPRPDEGPAQRPGGCARIPDRRGLGKGRRPGSAHQLDPQHDLGGLRQRLCQRLHPGRQGQAGLRPGRCALPHAAHRPGEAPRAQHRGQDGPLFLLCLRSLDVRFPEAGALQRLPVHQHPGRGGAGQELRRGHAGHGRDSSGSCRWGSATTGRGCPTRSGWRAPRRRCCMPSPSS